MKYRKESRLTRRELLRRVSATTVASLAGLDNSIAASSMPLETTRIRMVKIPSICQAPQYMAEEMLALEGFTDIQYIPKKGTVGIQQALASGEADINNLFASPATFLKMQFLLFF